MNHVLQKKKKINVNDWLSCTQPLCCYSVTQKLPVGGRSSDPGKVSPARKSSVSVNCFLVVLGGAQKII